jgi:isoquinoline 1-oxidoreductase beta subunit
MAAAALLARTPDPSDGEIDEALSHVLCRCGTYQRVRRAVHRAAEQSWDKAPFPARRLPGPAKAADEAQIALNPWIRIAAGGTVTVVIVRSEMGQWVTTSLPMLVAEELEVPLAQIRTEFAPVDRAYDNPMIGAQATAGSTSMQTSWTPLRRAGAEARERLIAAAAQRWGVSRRACRAENGCVLHTATGRKAGYGGLAEAAVRLPQPRHLQLKPPADFRVIGKPRHGSTCRRTSQAAPCSALMWSFRARSLQPWCSRLYSARNRRGSILLGQNASTACAMCSPLPMGSPSWPMICGPPCAGERCST